MSAHVWRTTGEMRPAVVRSSVPGEQWRVEWRCERCGAVGWSSNLPGDRPDGGPECGGRGGLRLVKAAPGLSMDAALRPYVHGER